MWAYFAHFDMPDDDPDALLRRLKVDYPIRVDRVIGLGTTPTVRLQRVLGREGHVGALEYALSMVHWSWFLVPHGTLLYMLVRHREQLPRSAGRVTWARSSTACRPFTGAGSSCRTARSSTSCCGTATSSRAPPL